MVSDPSVDLSIDRSMHNSRLIVDTKVKLVQGPFSAESGSSKRNLLGSAIVKQRSPNVSTSPVSDHASTSLLSPPRSLHVMSPNVSFQPSSPSRDDTMRATSEYVIAMHDYEPQQSNTTCLSFCTGNIIHVLNRDPSGWWDGEFEGRRGWFPSNYVSADPGESKDSAIQVSTGLLSFPSLFLIIRYCSCPSMLYAHAVHLRCPQHGRLLQSGDTIDSLLTIQQILSTTPRLSWYQWFMVFLFFRMLYERIESPTFSLRQHVSSHVCVAY